MEKTYTVRDVLEKCLELLEDGKGSWELEIEETKGQKRRLKDVQVVAIKPEGELCCLFG